MRTWPRSRKGLDGTPHAVPRDAREAKPKSKVEKLYRFLYLSHFAYGKLRGKSYNPNAEGIAARRSIARVLAKAISRARVIPSIEPPGCSKLMDLAGRAVPEPAGRGLQQARW
jgi:hypothetical protein